jgi:pre-mRNA-processing factor 8
MSPYHAPAVCYIKTEDPELPTFYFDEVINPISAYKMDKFKNMSDNFEVTDEDLDEFTVP